LFRPKRHHARGHGGHLNADALLEQLRRLQAEFDNYRKRAEQEKAQAAAAGQRELLARLLPAYDALEHMAAALHSVPPGAEALVEGLRAIGRQFAEAFEQSGVRRMAAVGERFDPVVHQAVDLVTTDDPNEDGLVRQVVQDGYWFNGSALRAARVVVARYEPPRHVEITV